MCIYIYIYQMIWLYLNIGSPQIQWVVITFPAKKLRFFSLAVGKHPLKKTAFPSGFPQHQMGGNPGHHPSQ